MFLLGMTSRHAFAMPTYRMSIFWTIIFAAWITFAEWFVVVSAVRCPQMCNCSLSNHSALRGKSLMLHCAGHHLNEQELNTLLSENELGESLGLISISNTTMTQIPWSVCRLPNLTNMYLDDNRLTGFQNHCFTNMTSLMVLSAKRNQITQLQDGVFDGLMSLGYLLLGWNRISDIGLNVFSNEPNVSNIKLWMIELNDNLLTSLDPWPFIQGLHGARGFEVYINLSNNFISNFTNKIGWRVNTNHYSGSFKLIISKNNIRHLNDIVVGWNLTTPPPKFLANAFEPFDNVDVSSSREYICDCQDITFYRDRERLVNIGFVLYTRLDGLQCSEPFRLANRSVLQVPLEEFVCELEHRCPPNCWCVYRPVNFMLHVNCSATNLPALPHYLPPLPHSYDKYKLDFSNNKVLRRLDYRSYFVNTSIFDVSNCAVDKIDLNIWRELLTNIQSVHLHGNMLTYFLPNITQIKVTSTSLSLSSNPWKCYCENQWMISWLKSLSSVLTNNADVVCASPSRLRNRSILNAGENAFCVDPVMRMLTIALSSTMSAVAFLLLLGFAVYRLRVKLYKRWKFHPFDRDECVGEGMIYDVFLCCSSEDSSDAFHILELMESKGYRVCYHERDFLPGELILGNITRGVESSKRSVCLISRNFVKR